MLVFVIVSVIFFLWWSSLGYPSQTPICEGPYGQQHCDNYNAIFAFVWTVGKTIDRWSALIGAIATVAIAGFTWVLYTSSEKMWAVTKISADAARVSAIVARKGLLEANQPIIAMKDVSLGTAAEIGEARVGFAFQNEGNSAAMIDKLDVEIRTLLKRGRTDYFRTDNLSDDWNAVVGPHSVSGVSFLRAPGLTAEEVNDIRSGANKIALIFKIFFHDALGTQYEAGFPFIYLSDKARFVRTGLSTVDGEMPPENAAK